MRGGTTSRLRAPRRELPRVRAATSSRGDQDMASSLPGANDDHRRGNGRRWSDGESSLNRDEAFGPLPQKNRSPSDRSPTPLEVEQEPLSTGNRSLRRPLALGVLPSGQPRTARVWIRNPASSASPDSGHPGDPVSGPGNSLNSSDACQHAPDLPRRPKSQVSAMCCSPLVCLGNLQRSACRARHADLLRPRSDVARTRPSGWRPGDPRAASRTRRHDDDTAGGGREHRVPEHLGGRGPEVLSSAAHDAHREVQRP